MEKIRIIIADDHQLFRNGLKILLDAFPDFEVAGEASNGEEFLKVLRIQRRCALRILICLRWMASRLQKKVLNCVPK
jgi:DNA-binding NarL/FixJ family response regulator